MVDGCPPHTRCYLQHQPVRGCQRLLAPYRPWPAVRPLAASAPAAASPLQVPLGRIDAAAADPEGRIVMPGSDVAAIKAYLGKLGA